MKRFSQSSNEQVGNIEFQNGSLNKTYGQINNIRLKFTEIYFPL